MSDTRLADILDALYDKLILESTLAAAIAAGDLTITDGPPITDFSSDSLLVVGGIPEQDNDPETTSTWDWSTLGRSGTYADIAEWIDIPLAVTSLSGDANVRTARRTAIGYYAKAAALIRGDWSGIDVVMWSICGPALLKQRQTADGAEVLLTFIARVRTQI